MAAPGMCRVGRQKRLKEEAEDEKEEQGEQGDQQKEALVPCHALADLGSERSCVAQLP